MLCYLGEHWGAGISPKGGHEWMEAGRTFFEYFILLFQVCIFFLSLFGVCYKSIVPRGKTGRKFLKSVQSCRTCAVLWSCNTKCESEVAQSCLTVCDPMYCSPPGSSVHGVFQARILEWVAISFSNKIRKGS